MSELAKKQRTDEECTRRFNIYLRLCSNINRYHLGGIEKHVCINADNYLDECAKKEINEYSGQIRYIPNKPEYNYLNVSFYKGRK